MIRRMTLAVMAAAVLCFPAGAESPASVDTQASSLSDTRGGSVTMTLALSRGVPFRIFTLDDPARLVIDFRGLDATGLQEAGLAEGTEAVSDLRAGVFRPGWSRVVADLTAPMLPSETGMAISANGTATLKLVLEPAAPADFAAASGVPETVLWARAPDTPGTLPADDDMFTVVIDPGHGGIDPGAERDGISEKTLMLRLAVELRDALEATGLARAVLTRQGDTFVSLQTRVALAHQAGADAFLSLHADALTDGGARGATVYTLSEDASDKATALLAARHNRADILAGADLTGTDDAVTGVLLDLARRETVPRTTALARALVKGMTDAGGPMNRHPLRKAGFSVLKSADIPSVLVEVGFLSSQRDLDNLRRPEWRTQMVGGLVSGLLAWHMQDEARRSLVRQ